MEKYKLEIIGHPVYNLFSNGSGKKGIFIYTYGEREGDRNRDATNQ